MFQSIVDSQYIPSKDQRFRCPKSLRTFQLKMCASYDIFNTTQLPSPVPYITYNQVAPHGLVTLPTLSNPPGSRLAQNTTNQTLEIAHAKKAMWGDSMKKCTYLCVRQNHGNTSI